MIIGLAINIELRLRGNQLTEDLLQILILGVLVPKWLDIAIHVDFLFPNGVHIYVGCYLSGIRRICRWVSLDIVDVLVPACISTRPMYSMLILFSNDRTRSCWSVLCCIGQPIDQANLICLWYIGYFQSSAMKFILHIGVQIDLLKSFSIIWVGIAQRWVAYCFHFWRRVLCCGFNHKTRWTLMMFVHG